MEKGVKILMHVVAAEVGAHVLREGARVHHGRRDAHRPVPIVIHVRQVVGPLLQHVGLQVRRVGDLLILRRGGTTLIDVLAADVELLEEVGGDVSVNDSARHRVAHGVGVRPGGRARGGSKEPGANFLQRHEKHELRHVHGLFGVCGRLGAGLLQTVLDGLNLHPVNGLQLPLGPPVTVHNDVLRELLVARGEPPQGLHRQGLQVWVLIRGRHEDLLPRLDQKRP
mmetsp:Transcript_70135/g.116958  ORF Transcript_70135/g.116958 Transcript_70135/m.116958 type:complete len:225 (-) Transcript_70135:2001-2675(-)